MEIELDCHPRFISISAGVSSVAMRFEFLTRCVAQKSAAFIELHKLHTTLDINWNEVWKVGSYHFQQVLRERGGINYHSQPVTDIRCPLLVSPSDVEQCWGEPLIVHLLHQLRAILVVQNIVDYPCKAVAIVIPVNVISFQIKLLHCRSPSKLNRVFGQQKPWVLPREGFWVCSVRIVSNREPLVYLPVHFDDVGWRQRMSCEHQCHVLVCCCLRIASCFESNRKR
mmetsp:Transcript_1513/g.3122  ORF Transcript_1513/g.3122 Transcript_1513/m.3122 type:complete len:226 (-) Transcript_1513:4-681(-)